MLANNIFAAMKEENIKTAKFITKERACLLPKTLIKFNGTWIQLMPNSNITLSQETRVGGISLIKDYEACTTSSRGVVRTNLYSKEQYIAQRARGAYLASICQPEASFDRFMPPSQQSFLLMIAALNKQLVSNRQQTPWAKIRQTRPN